MIETNFNTTENLKYIIKHKDSIIYNLQEKNIELELLVKKQNYIVSKLENELNNIKEKFNKQIYLNDKKFKRSICQLKDDLSKLNVKLQKNNIIVNNFENKNQLLLQTNLELRGESNNLKKYIKELDLIIKNNDFKIKELQDVIRNLDDNFYDTNLIKNELINNYDLMKGFNTNIDQITNILGSLSTN